MLRKNCCFVCFKSVLLNTILLGLLLIFGRQVVAQVSSVHVAFKEDSALIGDYIHLSISSFYKDGDVLFPVYKDSFSGFEIMESNPPFVKDSNGIKWKEQHLTLIQFNEGHYNFAPVPFIYKTSNKLDTIYSNPFDVYIKTITLDSTEVIKPIKGAIQVPYTLKEILPYVLIGLGAILLIALILYWYFVLRKRDRSIKKPVSKLEAHEIALQKLKALDAAKKWQGGDIKAYYLDLSEIIREYLENRFLMLAKESTTSEIILALKERRELDPGMLHNLKDLLELSDLAKFAKMLPLPNENMKAMKLAYDFVSHTKPPKESDETKNKLPK